MSAPSSALRTICEYTKNSSDINQRLTTDVRNTTPEQRVSSRLQVSVLHFLISEVSAVSYRTFARNLFSAFRDSCSTRNRRMRSMSRVSVPESLEHRELLSVTSVDLSSYVRVGRYDLPEPTRTTPPGASAWPVPTWRPTPASMRR